MRFFTAWQRHLLSVALLFVLNAYSLPGCATQPLETSKYAALLFPATYSFTLEHRWLTMRDGIKLSIDYYKPLPKIPNEKFPIVLEVLPYRKDDSFAMRDYPIYAYYAERGIAGARVDVRGTGASEGQVSDREYSDKELNDLPDIIKQLTQLPWSNGNIGLQGKSWSAINGMITSLHHPDYLKALLFLHGSDDLYGSDIHGWDGGLHIDMFTVEIDAENLMPTFPNYELDDIYFYNRFDVKPWIFIYLKHQRDGEFWRKKRFLDTNKRVAIFVMRIRPSLSMRTKMTRQLYAQAVLRQRAPQ